MQQHVGQSGHGSRGGKLKAAHVEAGRFLARMAQAYPQARSFSIDTARGISFNDGGVRTPLSLFHIVNFAEALKSSKQADRFEISGSRVTIHLNDTGLEGLHRFARAQKPDVPRKDSKTLMKARLLEAFRARETTSVAAPPKAVVEKKAHVARTSAALLLPILRTLEHGPKSFEELARLVSIRMRVARDARSEPYLENGTTFDKAVHHAVNYLIGRRLVAHPSRQVGLTASGRDLLTSGGPIATPDFSEPLAPAVAPATKPTRESASLSIRVMTEQDLLDFMTALPPKPVRDLLAIWRNAVRIVADESREAFHQQSRVMIRAIEHEWDRRSAEAALSDSFKWPEANAAKATQRDKPQVGCFADLVEHGMLKEMGYTVGRNGLPSNVRQKMLSEVFLRSLPPAFPKPYMEQWGANGSARRLHKIADSLAAFARNASRMDGNYDEAISDWQEDLQYLHDRHYVGTFGFGWPVRSSTKTASPGR